ncbi:MAG: hypothetical protein GEU26_19535 [Nitrososphaeraceae archaeon]|nr:hypothetical protein [Nitrososphaeraceae archaeon]
MNNKSLSKAVVAAVAVMLIATSAIATEDAFAGKKKKKNEYNQATSQANACGNGELPLNVGCQNTASQIQGDENAVAQTAQQTFP